MSREAVRALAVVPTPCDPAKLAEHAEQGYAWLQLGEGKLTAFTMFGWGYICPTHKCSVSWFGGGKNVLLIYRVWPCPAPGVPVDMMGGGLEAEFAHGILHSFLPRLMPSTSCSPTWCMRAVVAPVSAYPKLVERESIYSGYRSTNLPFIHFATLTQPGGQCHPRHGLRYSSRAQSG